MAKWARCNEAEYYPLENSVNSNILELIMDNLEILKKLKKSLIRCFSSDIDRIVLFGSHCKGADQAFSDYDILVVLKDDYDWRKEEEISKICYQIDLQYDIHTDVKVISLRELNSLKGKQPFIINAMKEGIAI